MSVLAYRRLNAVAIATATDVSTSRGVQERIVALGLSDVLTVINGHAADDTPPDRLCLP